MPGFAVESNRIEKAIKINAVLGDFLSCPVQGKKILDIGSGNGEIGDYFTSVNEVFSVDMTDQRRSNKTKFSRVNGEKLPFADNFFDVAISNHVIEHLERQRAHLSEINRVLRPGGICYIATPNRNFFREPHYKIPFIHYFPNSMFTGILRRTGKFTEQLFLLSHGNLSQMAGEIFTVIEYTHLILKQPKKYKVNSFKLEALPLSLLKLLNPVVPTNVFVLVKK